MYEKVLGWRYCCSADPVATPVLLLQRSRYHGTPLPYLKPLNADGAEGSQAVIRSAKRKDIGVELRRHRRKLGRLRTYARPTEPRFSMRTFTMFVISAMPCLAGFFGSNTPGFSAMKAM